MTVYSDKLAEMISSAPGLSDNLADNISQVNDTITEVQEQIDAITYGMTDVAADNLEEYLEGKALAMQTPTYSYQGEWLTSTSYSVNDLVTVYGDTHYLCTQAHTSGDSTQPGVGASWSSYWTTTITPLTTYRVSTGGSYNTIGYGNALTDWSIQLYNPGNPLAIPPVLPSWDDVYVYEGVGWDSDTNIVTFVDDWDFGNDYLTRPLTENATYGLIPYKASLNTAKTILTNNKNKLDDSVTYFEGYAT